MTAETKPCRRVFTEVLLEEAKRNPDIFVVTSDARGSVTLTDFVKELPGQFVEVGIAEQNAVGIGAGLALSGKNVFVCGPASFYSARSLEQIKVDVAYSGASVKVIGVSGGVSYGALGATHHSLHDLAVMRCFPGLNVYLPADGRQTEWLTRHLAGSRESAYVRMGRNAVPEVYGKIEDFRAGRAFLLREGGDITIIAAGETVYHSLEAAKDLAAEGIQARVLDMHTIKPLDTGAVLEAAAETSCILTVEEHVLSGGLGSAVAEICSGKHPVRMDMIGFPDENVIHAKPLEIFRHYGLTADNIAGRAKKLLSGK